MHFFWVLLRAPFYLSTSFSAFISTFSPLLVHKTLNRCFSGFPKTGAGPHWSTWWDRRRKSFRGWRWKKTGKTSRNARWYFFAGVHPAGGGRSWWQDIPCCQWSYRSHGTCESIKHIIKGIYKTTAIMPKRNFPDDLLYLLFLFQSGFSLLLWALSGFVDRHGGHVEGVDEFYQDNAVEVSIFLLFFWSADTVNAWIALRQSLKLFKRICRVRESSSFGQPWQSSTSSTAGSLVDIVA